MAENLVVIVAHDMSRRPDAPAADCMRLAYFRVRVRDRDAKQDSEQSAAEEFTGLLADLNASSKL